MAGGIIGETYEFETYELGESECGFATVWVGQICLTVVPVVGV